MSKLRVSLFGKFQIEYEQKQLSGFKVYKAQELFCYLLLYRDRPHHREVLANLLWGETPTDKSKRYLSKALWQLQTILNEQLNFSLDQFLQIDSDSIQLNSSDQLQLDVAIFEEVLKATSDVAGHTLEIGPYEKLNHAQQLYRGDLLEGWYQDWCLWERERLQNSYLAILEKLMDYHRADGAFEISLSYGRRILQYDPIRETTHFRLIELYYLAGNTVEAIRQYHRYRTALQRELGSEIEPGPQIQALLKQISAKEPVDQTHTTPPATPPKIWPSLLEHLDQLQVALARSLVATHEALTLIQKISSELRE